MFGWGQGEQKEMDKLAYPRDSDNDLTIVWDGSHGSVGLKALAVEVEPSRAEELTNGMMIMYHRGQILRRQ